MNVLESTCRLVKAARNFRTVIPAIAFYRIADPGNTNRREDAYCVDS
jgi:hypothetical protein